MKEVLPNITRTKRLRFDPPEEFFLVGPSTRRKITRALQMWYETPPITNETDQFIPFFEHLQKNVSDHWKVQQEYGSCLWATKYTNDSLATSLLLHYGWAPVFERNMEGSSIHKLTPTASGVVLDIEYCHTFQDRLDAACSAIESEIADRRSINRPLVPEEIISTGMVAFYYHQKRYCSVDKSYHTTVSNKLTHYIESYINALESLTPQRPEIHEPEDLLPDQTHELLFSKFTINDKPSAKQGRHLNDVALEKHIAALQPKLAGLPRDIPLRRKEFPDSMNRENFNSAKNIFKTLLQPKYGHYQIPSSIWGDP